MGARKPVVLDPSPGAVADSAYKPGLVPDIKQARAKVRNLFGLSLRVGTTAVRTGDPLTMGQEVPERIPPVDLRPQVRQKADYRFRIGLLTCVGTAGFEPATP